MEVAPVPEQIDVGVLLAIMVGVALTNKDTVLVLEQDPFEPVTV